MIKSRLLRRFSKPFYRASIGLYKKEKGSSGIPGCSEELDRRPQQRLAPPPNVVHELEEPQVQRQPLLRDPPMRAEPTPQQRPEAFERVDVHLAESIAVV